MFNDISKPPPPLPSPELTEVMPGVSLLRPLSRLGTGPGMIILTHDYQDSLAINEGVPSPLVKWAEEGYAVIEIQATALTTAKGDIIKSAVETLRDCDKCEPKDKVGLVGQCSYFQATLCTTLASLTSTAYKAYEPKLWNTVASTLSNHHSIVAAAVYADAPNELSSESLAGLSIPVIHHLAGKGPAVPPKSDLLKQYFYPNAKSYKFATPFQPSFHYNSENISHTRNLTLLKEKMGGPYFDLEFIWEEHTYYEFADRSMEHTMSTMVQEPYVNHIPTVS